MHITLHPERTFVHSEQPPGVIINALTARLHKRLFVFTSQAIYIYNPLTDTLQNEVGPDDTPHLSPNGWTTGHIPRF